MYKLSLFTHVTMKALLGTTKTSMKAKGWPNKGNNSPHVCRGSEALEVKNLAIWAEGKKMFSLCLLCWKSLANASTIIPCSRRPTKLLKQSANPSWSSPALQEDWRLLGLQVSAIRFKSVRLHIGVIQCLRPPKTFLLRGWAKGAMNP